MSETMVFRFHDGQSLRASIEHEAPLYYSLRDTAGNPLVVSRDRVREFVPLADVEQCPDAFSGAATDPGHRWDGDACALCGKSRKAAPASAEQASATDDTAKQALSDAGAQCGDCGDQPGDRICPACERCYQWYVAALRKAGWAPRTEVLREAIALIEDRADDADFTEEPLYIVGLRSAADLLKNAPAAVPVPDETAGDEPGEAPESPSPASLAANEIQALKDPAAIGYIVGVDTLGLILRPATGDAWSAWQERLGCDVRRTTYRGGVATAHGNWGDVPVNVTCHLDRIAEGGAR